MTDNTQLPPLPSDCAAVTNSGRVTLMYTAAQMHAYARAALSASSAAEPVAPERGQLDPRTAYATGKRMKAYCESFNGQQWGGLSESVDRKNLAVALENLEEASAMLMNMAERVPLGSVIYAGALTDTAPATAEQPAEPMSLTDEQIDTLLLDEIGFEGGLQDVNRDDLQQLIRAAVKLAATAPAPVAPTEEQLRAEQARDVMPLIGPLLDAWDGADNDTQATIREDAPNLAKSLIAINRAMEGHTAPAAPVAEVLPVTEEMVTAYLTANDAYWKRVDEMPMESRGTPREATRKGLIAAMSAAPPATNEEAK